MGGLQTKKTSNTRCPVQTEKIATVLRIAVKELTDDKWVRKKLMNPKTTELIDTLDLLEEATTETDQSLPMGCSYVKTCIEGIETTFLVDTGAEVSVVSDHLLSKLMKINNKLPTLPVTGMMVNGVIPNQTSSVKKQIMAKMKIGENTENITFLVLDGLLEEGIMGNDFLETHEAKIIYRTRQLQGDGEHNTVRARGTRKEQHDPINPHRGSTGRNGPNNCDKRTPVGRHRARETRRNNRRI